MTPLQTLDKNTNIAQLLCSLEVYTLIKEKMLCEHAQTRAVDTTNIHDIVKFR